MAGVNPDVPVPPAVAFKAAQHVMSKMGAPDQTMIDAAQSGKPVLAAEMLGTPGKVALKAAANKSPAVSGELMHTIEERQGSLQNNYADAFGQAAGVDPVHPAAPR